MRKETESFIVCDESYDKVDKVLEICRRDYVEGKQNYDFYNFFENIIYHQPKLRRKASNEIKRFQSLQNMILEGDFDFNQYEKTFPINMHDFINNFFKALTSSGHRNKNLTKNFNKIKYILEKLIKPIEQKIETALDSNFIITRCEEVITYPNAHNNSYFWHFDPVPIGFGKIFFYLSDSNKTDGKTNYVSFNDSSSLLKKGYNNIPPNRRLNGNELPKHLKEFEFGEKGKWLMFFPGSMLHRGGYPSFGNRRVFTVNFLRSEHNWHDKLFELWKVGSLNGEWLPSVWPIQK